MEDLELCGRYSWLFGLHIWSIPYIVQDITDIAHCHRKGTLGKSDATHIHRCWTGQSQNAIQARGNGCCGIQGGVNDASSFGVKHDMVSLSWSVG